MLNLPKKAVAFILLGLGILALTVGTATIFKQNRFSDAEAVITGIDAGYDMSEDRYYYTVYVEYSVDGTEYSGVLGYYEDSFEEGRTVAIKYNPENPGEIVEASSGFSIYLIVIGAAFAAVGTFALRKSREEQ